MKIAILTIFPDMLSGVLGASILGRARAQGLLTVEAVDIRPYSGRKHKNTDYYPFGGGAGMVMTAQPIVDCVQATRARGFTGPCLYLSPRGKPLTQQKVQQLAALDGFLLLCGHYEGVDQRAIDMAVDEEISLGDFVLTGGELAALAVADAVARLVPGVLGSSESAGDESFSAGLLEYPQYTRPRVYREQAVPDVLLGGDHAKINAWRRRQALLTTLQRRPDLFATAPMTHRERAETIEADRPQAKAATGGDSCEAQTRRADAAALAHTVEPSADLPEASATAETLKKAKKHTEAKAVAQMRPASKATNAAKPSKAGKKATVAKSSVNATAQATATDIPAKAVKATKTGRKHTETTAAAAVLPATKAASTDKLTKAGKKAGDAKAKAKTAAE